ncbi:MAG TPA: hypothetical protein VMB03_13685 [Bryobacteraceae bacterium]|nr:hypothetical protein [Tepidisphaeraceae bacterium]HUB79851.1 hypothetical protein [Bryobacteraceae bacterium]
MRNQLAIVGAAACSLLLAIPMIAAPRTAWPAETLSGTISMIDPALNTVVVQTSGGVPFDMVVTRNTRIESGNQTLTLQDLQQDTNRTVSVRFVPERRGDVARTIQLGS